MQRSNFLLIFTLLSSFASYSQVDSLAANHSTTDSLIFQKDSIVPYVNTTDSLYYFDEVHYKLLANHYYGMVNFKGYSGKQRKEFNSTSRSALVTRVLLGYQLINIKSGFSQYTRVSDAVLNFGDSLEPVFMKVKVNSVSGELKEVLFHNQRIYLLTYLEYYGHAGGETTARRLYTLIQNGNSYNLSESNIHLLTEVFEDYPEIVMALSESEGKSLNSNKFRQSMKKIKTLYFEKHYQEIK